jgi:hypothetical protein
LEFLLPYKENRVTRTRGVAKDKVNIVAKFFHKPSPPKKKSSLCTESIHDLLRRCNRIKLTLHKKAPKQQHSVGIKLFLFSWLFATRRFGGIGLIELKFNRKLANLGNFIWFN